MIEWFLINQFNLAKSLHLIALIAWMAGIFYLPRLFVYHCQVDVGSAEDKRFQTMETKLLRVIMNPAMILTWIAGIWMLALAWSAYGSAGWLHIKLVFVALITGFHMFCSRWRRQFAQGSNQRSERFYRLVNEVPTVALIVIVVMVVFKPFA